MKNPLKGGIFSGDNGVLVSLLNLGCRVMLWSPKNKRSEIIGKGVERRVRV